MTGKEAYEEDVKSRPSYHDGSHRKTWKQLGAVEQWTWERNPGPRPGGFRRAATAAALLLVFSLPAIAQESCHVNVATCKATECAYLPRIGPSKGAAIEAAHPATEAALDAVDGIGEATLAKIKPFVTYSGPTTCTAKQTAPKSTGKDGAK